MSPTCPEKRARPLTPRLRWLLVMLALSLAAREIVPLVQRSQWNKDRLYRKLLAGDCRERCAAAASLFECNAEEQLLRAMRSDSAEVRTMAAAALVDLWTNTGDEDAQHLLRMAGHAIAEQKYDGAFRHLTHLTRRHPSFTEGWTHRAALLCRLGDYERALADCRQAVLLNPNHFHAWHGMGMCLMHAGEYEGARKAFGNALNLVPHDQPTFQLLRQCEQLLQRSRQTQPASRPTHFEVI